jgi:hypothetical protein
MEEQEKMPIEPEESSEPSDKAEQDKQPVPEPAPSTPSETLPDFEPIDVGGETPDIKPAEVFVPEEALAPEKTRGGRFKDAVRRFFIWLLVFAFVYLAGVVTIYILELQPAKDALEETQLDLEGANQTIAELQIELEQAQFNQSYKTFLEIKADIFVAQLALTGDDTAGAKIALRRVEENLNLILEEITAFDQALADSLVDRLDLVVNNIDSDIETSLIDVRLFAEDLDEVYQGVYAGE